jgi:hypothetical protein
MMKRIFLLAIGCLICGVMKAQHQQIFDEFRQEVGDQAEMFAGKVEPGYPSTVYINHPYWLTDNFSQGDVVFRGLTYRNVSVRYDAYLKQLVVNTPVKRQNVSVPMDLVEKFTLGGIRYERRKGEFMAILYSSPRIELVQQMNVMMREKLVDNVKVQYEFKPTMKYCLYRDGQVYEVTNLKSVSKLYPHLKKELKQFAKKYHLDFKENRQLSLGTLVKYADEWVGQP